MLRRAVDVAVFAPLGAVATLAAAVARRGGRPPVAAKDEVGAEPAATAVDADEPVTAPHAWSGGDLPIEGYDHLAASQVVDRLDHLTPRERDLVATYERAHRHRQSVLAKVAQLQA
jgi:hypothetical protein